jgi:hypothetical protein
MIKKAWTGYAAALSAMILIGEVANLTQGGTVDFRTLANWIVTGALLIATWGYALQRRIGREEYWRGACWVVIGAILVTAIPAVLAGADARFMVIMLLPLVLPAFYAAYRYAYRSPQLWRAEEPAA